MCILRIIINCLLYIVLFIKVMTCYNYLKDVLNILLLTALIFIRVNCYCYCILYIVNTNCLFTNHLLIQLTFSLENVPQYFIKF